MNKPIKLYLLSLPVVLTVAPSSGLLGTSLRFSAGLIALFLVMQSWKNTTSQRVNQGFLAIAVILVSLFIATLAAPSLLFGISRLLNWGLFIPLFFFFRNNSRALELFLKGMLLASAIQLVGVALQLLGLLGGLWGGQIISGIGYDPNYSQWLIRYTGFVLDANSLGMIFAIAAITSLHYSTQKSFSKQARISFFVFSAVNLFSILLTGSRGGILIAAITLVSYLVISKKFTVIGQAIPVIVLVVIAGVQFAGFEFLLSSIFAIFDGTDTSANLRAELWQYAISRSGDWNFFFGEGFGARNPSLFTDQNTIFVDPALLKFTTLDNSWLKTYLELGGLAVLALGLLFFIAIRNNLSTMKGNPAFNGLPAALLILFLLRSTSIDAFDINPWNSVIWIILGSMIGSKSEEQREDKFNGKAKASSL